MKKDWKQQIRLVGLREILATRLTANRQRSDSWQQKTKENNDMWTHNQLAFVMNGQKKIIIKTTLNTSAAFESFESSPGLIAIVHNDDLE